MANETKQDFGLILTKYALERLLYRLGTSPHSNAFVLKGALLFELWTSQQYRPTRDLDLLGYGDSSLERYQAIFTEICGQEVEADGLVFLPDTIRVDRIRDDEEYEGVRVLLQSRLGNARIPLQIDVGFGDVVTPAPVEVVYPTMLDLPAPRLKAYPRETVVAEKFEAMVKLGMANSRMKDFYDVWTLSKQFEFEGPILSRAIQATFERRGTALPSSVPLALTSEFYDLPAKQIQWTAFLRKSGLKSTESLHGVATYLKSFLAPPVEALQRRAVFGNIWHNGGPWSSLT